MGATVAAIATVLLVATSAGATGWLVNAQVGTTSVKSGTNAFGGQGDTLDVQVLPATNQCSDEDDVVDVSVGNHEGDAGCAFTQGKCEAENGGAGTFITGPGFVIFIPTPANPTIGPDAYHPHDPHCSDDGDTVDVGILNQEGGFANEWGPQCREAPPESPDVNETSNPQPAGDQDDAVDVGVGNEECNDRWDAADAGVLNCEWSDEDDGVDVGVDNREDARDDGDVFDLSLFNLEVGDAPDRNGANIGSSLGLYELLCPLEIRPLP